MRPSILVVACCLLVPTIAMSTVGQGPPEPPEGPPSGDAGPIFGPLDGLLGDTVPPAVGTVYDAIGQNITREDVRLYLDLNITKAEINALGLILGSGKAEVQAAVRLRVEMRVISTDRIRAALEGENAYNVSAENATFLSEVYLPAEVFRASLAAEVIAAFQEDQERAIADYLAQAVPELEVLGLKLAWKNTQPHQALTDFSLTEPPIVLEANAILQYLRVESIPSLLAAYAGTAGVPEDPEAAYAKRLKEEHGDPLRARDFFSAAAYTQLLNLSMQPGWSLGVHLSVPRGFSFEYANEAVERHGDRAISFQVDALEANDRQQEVLLTSITHRRAVALALFTALWGVGLAVAFPLRFLYVRYRLPRVAHPAPPEESS